jgi:beta-N-acetylhexosaminidase
LRAREKSARAILSAAFAGSLLVAVLATAVGPAGAEPGASISVSASRLTNAQLVGERIIVGFSGTSVPRALRDRIEHGGVAGVILFSSNFTSKDGARRLINRLQAIPRPQRLRDPLLIMIDQEGGLVKRLPGAPCCSAETMGARGADFSREQGFRTGRNLHGVGVNVDLAPVLDVARPGSAIGSEHRAFGTTGGRASRTANRFAYGLQQEGVAATAKHFPGLGAARVNTDMQAQRIGLSRQTLREVDEHPYHRFNRINGRVVMISNAIYTAFSNRPAAFTRELAVRELRHRLGFDGVSVSDSLEAAALNRYGSAGSIARRVAKAGTDLLLFTAYRDGVAAIGSLKSALREGKISRQNFKQSAQRVLDLRARL